MRLTIYTVAALLISGYCQHASAESLKPVSQANGVDWFDVRDLGVEGQGWTDIKSPFDRLPSRAESIVRKPIWGLSRHSAGLFVRFQTDASTIHASWALTSSRLDMPHMPATGVSGLDLYAKDDKGRWRWLTNGQPKAQQNRIRLVSGIPSTLREFCIYFPLYKWCHRSSNWDTKFSQAD